MAFSEFELVDEQIATSSTDEGALNICPDDERPSDDRATGADWSNTVDRKRANIWGAVVGSDR